MFKSCAFWRHEKTTKNKTGCMQMMWKQKTPLSYAGLRFYVDRNTCPLTALALFPSGLFPFIWSSAKIISTWLPEKRWMLTPCGRGTCLTLNCPKIQCQDYIKHSTNTNTIAARLMHAPPENSELGILQTGNQINCKTGLEVFMIMFFLLIFIFCYKIQPNRMSKQVCQLHHDSPLRQPYLYTTVAVVEQRVCLLDHRSVWTIHPGSLVCRYLEVCSETATNGSKHKVHPTWKTNATILI